MGRPGGKRRIHVLVRSGEIKHFLRLTERGLAYSVNLAGPVSKEKTEVAIYPSRLGAILRQCHGGLGRYIEMNVP
jgi:hypothetical protein